MKFHADVAALTGAHVYETRVYYEDTDAGGVVYHANYLRFAERARTEALRAAGVPHGMLIADHGLMFMVRQARMDYAAPARLDDALLIRTQTRAVRAASVDLRQSVHRAGRDAALVVIDLQLACVRTDVQRPARIPPAWRDVLARWACHGDAALAPQ